MADFKITVDDKACCEGITKAREAYNAGLPKEYEGEGDARAETDY